MYCRCMMMWFLRYGSFAPLLPISQQFHCMCWNRECRCSSAVFIFIQLCDIISWISRSICRRLRVFHSVFQSLEGKYQIIFSLWSAWSQGRSNAPCRLMITAPRSGPDSLSVAASPPRASPPVHFYFPPSLTHPPKTANRFPPRHN